MYIVNILFSISLTVYGEFLSLSVYVSVHVYMCKCVPMCIKVYGCVSSKVYLCAVSA